MAFLEIPADGLPLPGASRYVLRRLLGSGGFGDAYLADDMELTRPVVIKVLVNQSDQSIRERFKFEARVAAKIRHPNVVQVFDIGVLPDGQPYYIMEYVEGQALTGFVRQRHPVPLFMALGLIAESADALHSAHRIGAIHRDVKPDNILVSNEGRAKVIDFGIAKAFDPSLDTSGKRETVQGRVPGTPRYMSPEQAKGMQLTPASDLYSLGCVMYFTLTGRSPFEGTPQQLLAGHVMQPPPTLAAAGVGVHFPAEIEQLVARLLAKEPADRFQSGDELARALRKLSQKAREQEESDTTQAIAPFQVAAPPPSAPAVTPSAGTVSAVSMNVAAAPPPTPQVMDASAQTDLWRVPSAPHQASAAPAPPPPLHQPVVAALPPVRTNKAPVAVAIVAGVLVLGGGALLARSLVHRGDAHERRDAKVPATAAVTTTSSPASNSSPATPSSSPEPPASTVAISPTAPATPLSNATSFDAGTPTKPLTSSAPPLPTHTANPAVTTKPTAKPASTGGSAADDQY